MKLIFSIVLLTFLLFNSVIKAKSIGYTDEELNAIREESIKHTIKECEEKGGEIIHYNFIDKKALSPNSICTKNNIIIISNGPFKSSGCDQGKILKSIVTCFSEGWGYNKIIINVPSKRLPNFTTVISTSTKRILVTKTSKAVPTPNTQNAKNIREVEINNLVKACEKKEGDVLYYSYENENSTYINKSACIKNNIIISSKGMSNKYCEANQSFDATECFLPQFLSSVKISKATTSATTKLMTTTTRTIPVSTSTNEKPFPQSTKSIKFIEINDMGVRCNKIGGNYLYHKYRDDDDVSSPAITSICVKEENKIYEILEINEYNIPVTCYVGDKLDDINKCFASDTRLRMFEVSEPLNEILPANTNQLLEDAKKSREEEIEKDSNECKEMGGDILYYNYIGRSFTDINSFCAKENNDGTFEILNLNRRVSVRLKCKVGSVVKSVSKSCFYHVSIIEEKKIINY